MRKLLLAFGLAGALICTAHAADEPKFITTEVPAGTNGTLEIPAPADWTITYTNLLMPGNPPTLEFHPPNNSLALRITLYWDGFGANKTKLTDADFDRIVSNVAKMKYVPVSVEGTFTLEKLKGDGVSGTFARFTDRDWTPVLKNEFPNLTTGMFRCGNLWGNFDLLTSDKDGPSFKAGLKVLQAMRRKQ
jgi:hypothetical protein